MAKIKKLNSERKNDNSQEDLSFDDFLTMLQQEFCIDTDSLMDYNPEECDLELLQDDIEALWLKTKDEMGE